VVSALLLSRFLPETARNISALHLGVAEFKTPPGFLATIGRPKSDIRNPVSDVPRPESETNELVQLRVGTLRFRQSANCFALSVQAVGYNQRLDIRWKGLK
jgi:hypothetical protein